MELAERKPRNEPLDVRLIIHLGGKKVCVQMPDEWN
jgi:hypothetical protein